MDIHTKLKDQRTFLLGGALFALLLLCLSSVSAAEFGYDIDRVLPDSNVKINQDNVGMYANTSHNGSNIVVNKKDDVEISNINIDNITINKNTGNIILRNIICDVLIVENGGPSYIDILDSNIEKVIIRNITCWSLLNYKCDIKNSNIDSLIIEDSRIPHDIRISFSYIGNMTLNNSSIHWLILQDHSNVIIEKGVGSTINLVDVHNYSFTTIKKAVGSTIKLIDVYGRSNIQNELY